MIQKGRDLTDQQFGRWTVIKYVGTDSTTRNHLWLCRCKCGNEQIKKGIELTRTNGTVTCSKCRIIDGINDIPTFAPWMQQYFKDKNDIYKYTYGSGKKILVKCPDCGREKYVTVKDLYNHKSIGCICSDSISYPEKFMFSFLEQQGVKFEYQYSPSWIENKRYDFYIKDKNLIIEVDGGIGHGNRYTFSNKTPEELIAIDKYKDEQAIKHNINIIRINAYPSNFDVLVSSITKELDGIFDINKVDFNICDRYGTSNLVKEVCQMWDSNNTIKNLMEIFQLSDTTIKNYLKRGNKLGWCNYDPQIEIEKRIKRSGKKIKVYKNNIYLGEYESCADFARQFNAQQTNMFINRKSFANALNNNGKYKDFYIEEVN